MFHDQVVWITGASAGIGRALALGFADRGADVVVSARREDRLREVVAEVEARGRRGLALACDVSDEAQVRGAVDSLVREFGRLDVAVANAGYAVTGPVEKLSIDDWRRQFDVNIFGLVLTARYALPHLIASRGRMALVASVAAIIPTPGAAPYGASKAAVRSIGQALAVELHGSGASCTTLLPGFVESDIGRVDNEGIYRPDSSDRLPAQLTWPADRAARVMIRAIHRRKREYVFTGHGKVGALVGRHFPGLTHFVMARLPRRWTRH